jgi:subtilisin family serine protease
VVRQALLNAFRHGVVVVASAGNSGTSSGAYHDGQAPESFPADYPGVISVGAVDSNGTVAGFSSDNLSVQVAAPGVNVPAQGRDGSYWYVSGTSPACALVAGVAALIKARYPDLAPDLVAKALTSTTTGRPASGYDSQVGFGIVDAAAALARAGQLSGHQSVGAGLHGIAAAAHFGGGPVAVAPAPVRPRGSSPLVLFAVLALTSVVLAGAAATRLAILSRSRE